MKRKGASKMVQSGVVLREIRTEQSESRLFLCLVRGLLIFMASFGTVGAVAGSFALPFSLPAVAAALFLLSMLCAFVYFNRVTFYAGYLSFFAAFAFFAVAGFSYINSGFQAFANTAANRYSDFFNLPFIREAEEIIADRYLTVSCAMIFIGAVYALILNIVISGYMNVFFTFLITFLTLQLPFYIDIVPPTPYLVMLLAVYITVGILGRSGYYALPYKRKRGMQFKEKRTRRVTKYRYLSSGMGMLVLSAYGVLFSAVFLLLTMGLFSSSVQSRYVSNEVKDRTDEYVKLIAQGGLTAMFNRYQATGGLARGRLGGVGSVNPDFQTDLRVRFIPTDTGRVYLKAYTGVFYETNYFRPAADGMRPEAYINADSYVPDTPLVLKMQVENVGADLSFDYKPYFPLATSSGKRPYGSGISEELTSYAAENMPKAFVLLEDGNAEKYDVLYTPFTFRAFLNEGDGNSTEGTGNPMISPEYESFIHENYLQIPEELSEVLSDAAGEAGLSQAPDALDAANKLYRYFIENYSYTMAPGTTPMNTDVVEYFLSVQKRGYCAHFASAGTLILRSAGIPARYAEGYVVDPGDILESSVYSEDPSGWYRDGGILRNELGGGKEGNGTGSSEVVQSELAVIETEIPDASAHAWVEIYVDGVGWIPYEMTPPSDSYENSPLSFAGFFYGIFRRTSRNAGELAEAEDEAQAQESASGMRFFPGSMDFLLRPVLILLAAILGGVLLLAAWCSLRPRFALFRALRRKDYNEALLTELKKTAARLKKEGKLHTKNPSVEDIMQSIAESVNTQLSKEDIAFVRELLNEAAYSGKPVNSEDYKKFKKIFEGTPFF